MTALKLVEIDKGDTGAAIDDPALKSGGSDGTFGDMETRLRMLEYRADQTEKLLTRMDGKLDGIGRDVSEMKGRMMAMPTTWQMVSFVIALVVALYGFLHFGPH